MLIGRKEWSPGNGDVLSNMAIVKTLKNVLFQKYQSDFRGLNGVLIETRNITETDEYPQLVPNNIHMYEKFKGP